MSRSSLTICKYTRRKKWHFLIFFSIIIILFLVSIKGAKNQEILNALGSRNGSELTKPEERTTIFQPVKKCQGNGQGKLAIFMVTTLPESIERRNAIRKTWASWSSDHEVMVFFFTGRPILNSRMQDLEDEVYLHGDLILEDLREDYHALTIKTLRMLKWFLNQCAEAKFLVKTDDDVFINVPTMMEHLTQVTEDPTLYPEYIGGEVHVGREPHDFNPFSKWYIPSSLWPTGETFPPYTGGPCYILSSKVVPKLFSTSLATPLINLEDVFLTGVVGHNILGIELQSLPNMYDAHYPRLHYYSSSDSDIKSSTAYHTDGDIKLMHMLYESVSDKT